MKTKYENFVLQGGGVLGVAYLGALDLLYKNGSIQNVINFAGSSVGSFVALFLAVRVEYQFLYDTIMNLDFTQFKDGNWFIADLVSLLRKYGFYKGDNLLLFLQKTIMTITGLNNPTFSDIYKKYGTSLIVTGTNLTKCRLEYFTKETHPDMPVCLACRISSTIPYFFRPIIFNGDIFVDGGTLNNYPIDYFNGSDKTLGLKLVSTSSIQEERGNLGPITDIKDFSQRLFDCIYNQSLKIHVKSTDWLHTIRIDTGNTSFIDFNLTDNDKKYLVEQGAKGINDFFNTSG